MTPLSSLIVQQLLQKFSSEKAHSIAKILAARTYHITLVLEDLFHEHHVATMIRTAECFGIQDAHLIKVRHQIPLFNSISKGAQQWVSIHEYSSSKACLSALKSQGYKIVATVPDNNALALHELPLEHKIALCFGTERQGLTADVLEQADYRITIPMKGFTQSFNVAQSASIIMYDVIRRLEQSSINWTASNEEQYALLQKWNDYW